MNCFSAAEAVANFVGAAKKKVSLPIWKMLLLGVLAGMFIALGGVSSGAASHAVTDAGLAKTLSGVLFPGGLALVVLMGAELFTGNCLIFIGVLDGKVSFAEMLKNWIFVYLGNFIGSIIVAGGCAFFGQMNLGGGAFGAACIKTAAAKVSLPFANAVVLGFFCNLAVCFAVLAASEAKDVAGKIIGVFFPIAFFVICGFEHCVANMYYVPAGIFASQVPAYAGKAAEMGADMTKLTWGAFFTGNLLPVTIGNILGGLFVAAAMYAAYKSEKK